MLLHAVQCMTNSPDFPLVKKPQNIHSSMDVTFVHSQELTLKLSLIDGLLVIISCRPIPGDIRFSTCFDEASLSTRLAEVETRGFYRTHPCARVRPCT